MKNLPCWGQDVFIPQKYDVIFQKPDIREEAPPLENLGARITQILNQVPHSRSFRNSLTLKLYLKMDQSWGWGGFLVRLVTPPEWLQRRPKNDPKYAPSIGVRT